MECSYRRLERAMCSRERDGFTRKLLKGIIGWIFGTVSREVVRKEATMSLVARIRSYLSVQDTLDVTLGRLTLIPPIRKDRSLLVGFRNSVSLWQNTNSESVTRDRWMRRKEESYINIIV